MNNLDSLHKLCERLRGRELCVRRLKTYGVGRLKGGKRDHRGFVRENDLVEGGEEELDIYVLTVYRNLWKCSVEFTVIGLWKGLTVKLSFNRIITNNFVVQLSEVP